MTRSVTRLAAMLLLILPVLFLAPNAAAQNGQLSVKVLGLDGKPWPGVAVTITSKDSGLVFKATTDKEGRFLQVGLRDGLYDVNFRKDNVNYTDQIQIFNRKVNKMVENFQVIAKKHGFSTEAAEKQKEAHESYQAMKTHFDSGKAAMTEADQMHQQMSAAPAGQKSTLQAKMSADYQTAITEFQQAQKATTEKDPNLSVILGQLGLAYEKAGKFDDATATFQKAVALKPVAPLYGELAINLAHQGKTPEATAACQQAATLDPASAEVCWKNLGVVFTNLGQMQEAVGPLQKATQANPHDPDAWYLLGGALAGTITTKQVGSKITYIIPPGTTEAYQKCIQLAPTGPRAPEAKAALEGLRQLSGGASTTLETEKKKKH